MLGNWQELKNSAGRIEFVNLGTGNFLKISQGSEKNEWFFIPIMESKENTFKMIMTVDEVRDMLKNNKEPKKLLG